ncbi:hypothetical protein GDO86_015093 [Hymenochirus boettgeri]|uniref:HSF-type DNA-binding domain-containing protein n=1 Tax=Hymenochirus boettgeri TaxID=247094 RepID=A0A8T2JW58_9PIPI|nr:hypothetical protein GDO86_015093 [Hymenochirus boettgeri]KAG8447854.1 hypothetical protein GDO86_015093 [Hymenochirus boettgeri]
MKEPSAALGQSAVPGFLTKLWVLVEDQANSDIIAWNWNGQNFCILDEQRFSKEILPKYFKHNNLSSFIRQLNMYGFRKVVSLENGLVKSESALAIEFQHPFFKKGMPELLENIKRKVAAVKSDEPRVSHDNLQKVISELQELQDVQSNMDAKLENMRRENEVLWKEVSSLRRKHNQQQKLLAKIFQFILSLMKGNVLMGTNRKRPLTMEASKPPLAKYSRKVLQLGDGKVNEVNCSSQQSENTTEHAFVIHEISTGEEGSSEQAPKYIFNVTKPTTSESHQDAEEEISDGTILELSPDLEQWDVPSNLFLVQDQSVNPINSMLAVFPSTSLVSDCSSIPSSSTGDELALDMVQDSTAEDPDSVINSILNENATLNNSDILDREEIQDFLNCIDASLEDIQNMLSKKKLTIESDIVEEIFPCPENTAAWKMR